jgi:hypothetical protein
MERIMKLQDVLLKAMAKKITWWEAAEIIGVADRRKGKIGSRRVLLKTCEEVLRLPAIFLDAQQGTFEKIQLQCLSRD